MSDTTTMSIRLPLSLKTKIEMLAQATKRSKSFCVVEAITKYLDSQAWQIEAIQEGIHNLDNNETIDHLHVKQWVESWDTENEKRDQHANKMVA